MGLNSSLKKKTQDDITLNSCYLLWLCFPSLFSFFPPFNMYIICYHGRFWIKHSIVKRKKKGGERFGRRWENCLLLKLATLGTQNTDTQWSGQEQSIRLESWQGSTRKWCCQCASPKRKPVSTVMFGPRYGQMWMYSALKFQLHQMCASVQLQQEFIFFNPFRLCLGWFFFSFPSRSLGGWDVFWVLNHKSFYT